MTETADFDSNDFESKLTKLKDTQEGIQGLSAWCLQRKVHHKKIVSAWLNVLKNGKLQPFLKFKEIQRLNCCFLQYALNIG